MPYGGADPEDEAEPGSGGRGTRLGTVTTRRRPARYPLTLTSCANSAGPVRERSLTMPIPGP
jgi:hypothetical protein